jgi:hypothetical protein
MNMISNMYVWLDPTDPASSVIGTQKLWLDFIRLFSLTIYIIHIYVYLYMSMYIYKNNYMYVWLDPTDPASSVIGKQTYFNFNGSSSFVGSILLSLLISFHFQSSIYMILMQCFPSLHTPLTHFCLLFFLCVCSPLPSFCFLLYPPFLLSLTLSPPPMRRRAYVQAVCHTLRSIGRNRNGAQYHITRWRGILGGTT